VKPHTRELNHTFAIVTLLELCFILFFVVFFHLLQGLAFLVKSTGFDNQRRRGATRCKVRVMWIEAGSVCRISAKSIVTSTWWKTGTLFPSVPLVLCGFKIHLTWNAWEFAFCFRLYLQSRQILPSLVHLVLGLVKLNSFIEVLKWCAWLHKDMFTTWAMS
jgi:hypothetical protein